MPTEQGVQFQQALREQQAAVLESIQVSYTELMSASTRAERDRLLLYTLVGFAIGVGNFAAVSLIPTSIPYWVLNTGFSLTLLFFCTTYFISLRSDERRLTAARNLKMFYAKERFKDVMDVVGQGIELKQLEPNWLADQDAMAQRRTDELFNLQENFGLDALTLHNAQNEVSDRYEKLRLKNISGTYRVLITEGCRREHLLRWPRTMLRLF